MAVGVEPDRKVLKKIKTVTTNDKVYKFSADSGLTEGTVRLTNAITLLNIYDKSYYFRDQIYVEIPYAPEDRGTLGLVKSEAIFNKADSAFGMCIGGTPRMNLAFFTPLENITNLFNISLLLTQPKPQNYSY